MATTTKSAPDREQVLRNLNDFIRRFQRASGFGLRSYGNGVSEALKTHAVMEICCASQVTINKLCQALAIAQSTASRVIVQLQREGLIAVTANIKDKRSSFLIPTPAGEDYYRQFNLSENGTYDRMMVRLSNDEKGRLLSLQKVFADHLGATPATFSDDVHPMRKNTLRITRGLRLLRSDLMRQYSLSILGWHFLSIIEHSRETVSAIDLCSLFKAPPNTAATILKQLSDTGHIKRHKLKEDNRRQVLEITAQGKSLLKQITEGQLSHLRNSVTGMSTGDLTQLTELSEKLSVESESKDNEIVLSPRITLRELKTPEELDAGRRLLLTYLLSGPSSLPLPEHILLQAHKTTGLYRENTLMALAEFSVTKTQAKLIHIVFDKSLSPFLDQENFIKQSRAMILKPQGHQSA